MDFVLEITQVYKGIHYTALSVLENDLLLVVPTEDLNNGKYPLSPVVIPFEVE